MNAVKLGFQSLKIEAKQLLMFYFSKENLQLLNLGLGILLLATQLAIVSFYLHQASDTQGLIRSIDVDAGLEIEKSIKTQLYNDNGLRGYGVLPFRMVRVMNMLAPSPITEAGAPATDSIEKQHHFLKMLGSYLSLVAFCLLVSWILFANWGSRLLSTGVLVGAFCHSYLWAEMLLRVHPDHVLAFTTALATWLTWKFFISPESKSNFIWAASSWGLVAAVKMTVLMFAPAILIFFYPFKKEILRPRFKTLLGVSLMAYMVVGFPQNLDIFGVIGFLTQQKRNVISGDWEFFKIWLETFGEQLQMAPLVLVSLAFLLPAREPVSKVPWNKYFIFAGFFVLPTLSLMSRRLTSAHQWYPMPFISSLFVVAAIGLFLFRNQLRPLLPMKLLQWQSSPIYTLAALLAIPSVFGVLPDQMNKSLSVQMDCRPEARVVMKEINAAADNGQHILVDAYVPYSTKYHDKEVLFTWEMRPKLIDAEKTKMIVLKQNYYLQYLPQNEGGVTSVVDHIEDWDSTRSFYRMFHNKVKTTDQHGHTWSRTHTDRCQWEIWKRD